MTVQTAKNSIKSLSGHRWFKSTAKVGLLFPVGVGSRDYVRRHITIDWGKYVKPPAKQSPRSRIPHSFLLHFHHLRNATLQQLQHIFRLVTFLFLLQMKLPLNSSPIYWKRAAMLGDIAKADKVYIACGYTDMRRSIDGLVAIVQENCH